jgi:Domain of unknown function (DUF4034)
MKNRAEVSGYRPRALTIGSALLQVAALLTILFAMSLGARAGEKPKSAKGCEFSDAQFDVANDVRALDGYRNAIGELLKEKRFKDLDCLADAARTSNARFSGGQWKLRNICIGLQSPRPGHPTEVDWKQHMKLIETWKDSNPNSVTATIALAESYTQYAWAARGTGYSDDVSQSGWKLLAERAAKARKILEESEVTTRKDPNWYLTMQLVAQAQSWSKEDAGELFAKAVKFEPGYQYYDRTYAVYLQPKWSGEEGDPAKLAEESANRLGGEAGDALYFQIAEVIVCACADPEFGHFSWPRAQKGFAAMEKLYGPSMLSVNSFALMATKATDWSTADDAFKRIGSEFDEKTWTSEQWFKQMRDLSAQMGPQRKQFDANRRESEENRRMNEAYQKEFERKLVSFEQNCVAEAAANEGASDVFLKVGKDGDVLDFAAEHPLGHFGSCVSRALYVSHANHQIVLPAPPRDNYWVHITFDPTSQAASAK